MSKLMSDIVVKDETLTFREASDIMQYPSLHTKEQLDCAFGVLLNYMPICELAQKFGKFPDLPETETA